LLQGELEFAKKNSKWQMSHQEKWKNKQKSNDKVSWVAILLARVANAAKTKKNPYAFADKKTYLIPNP